MSGRLAVAAAASLALAAAPANGEEAWTSGSACPYVACSSFSDWTGTFRGQKVTPRLSTGEGSSLRCLYGMLPTDGVCPPKEQCFFDTGKIHISCRCKDKWEAEEQLKEEAEPYLLVSLCAIVVPGGLLMYCVWGGNVLSTTSWLENFFPKTAAGGSAQEPEVVEAEVVGVAEVVESWQGEANPNLVADGEANPNLVAGGEAKPNLGAGNEAKPNLGAGNEVTPAPAGGVQAEGAAAISTPEVVLGHFLLGVPPLLICAWAYAASASRVGVMGDFGLLVAFVAIIVHVVHSADVARRMLGRLGLRLSVQSVLREPLPLATLLLLRTISCVAIPGAAGAAWAMSRMADAEGHIDPDRLC